MISKTFGAERQPITCPTVASIKVTLSLLVSVLRDRDLSVIPFGGAPSKITAAGGINTTLRTSFGPRLPLCH